MKHFLESCSYVPACYVPVMQIMKDSERGATWSVVKQPRMFQTSSAKQTIFGTFMVLKNRLVIEALNNRTEEKDVTTRAGNLKGQPILIQWKKSSFTKPETIDGDS